MDVQAFLDQLGQRVDDIDEARGPHGATRPRISLLAEVFDLFSHNQGDARDLGFVDAKAATLSVSLGDDLDVTVTQSPGLLHSSIKTGTTGAVLWRVSPLVAGWLRLPSNVLFTKGILNKDSTVLELGCGISGVVALATAPKIGMYICTDQQYVLKQLMLNLAENSSVYTDRRTERRENHRSIPKGKQGAKSVSNAAPAANLGSNIQVLELDWETTSLASLASAIGNSSVDHLDLVVACDCIYNSYLVEPFVKMCVEACNVRNSRPVLCLVAQQLRSEEVFQEWLAAFSREFVTWRVPGDLLNDSLRDGLGFALHIGILRSAALTETL